MPSICAARRTFGSICAAGVLRARRPNAMLSNTVM
jgi:hypothetical protein